MQAGMPHVRLLHELRGLLLKSTGAHAPHALAYAALVAVCILWGTTYLGIRVSLESLPPLYLIAIRYTISGAILLIALRTAGMQFPPRREFLLTAACGAICIGVGNGFLAIAEVTVPSGLAALFYTTSPFWMVGIDAVLPQGRKPFGPTLLGLAIGLAGVVYLIWPAIVREGWRGGTLTGFFILQLSAVGWVTGALLQKRVPTRSLPIMTGAVQQLAAGLATFIPALLTEHLPHAISPRSEFAVAYLVVFGSLIGFTSFIYCMARLPVAVVSIYTFVNPIVAVFLGWLFFREPFGTRQFLAMLIVFAGIAVVRFTESSFHSRLLQPSLKT